MRLASAVIQPYLASQDQRALVARGYAQTVPDSVETKGPTQRMSRNPLEHVRKLIIECTTRCNYSCSHCYNAGEGYGNISERPLVDILNSMQDSLIYRLHAGRRIGDYLHLVDPGVFGNRFAHPCALRAVTTMIARRMLGPGDSVALQSGRRAMRSREKSFQKFFRRGIVQRILVLLECRAVLSMQAAYERFSELLRTGGYDVGILGGDLLNEYMTEEKVRALLGVPDDDPAAVWKNSGPYLRQEQAREVRIRLFEDMLDAAHVPVFLVLGNHDLTSWPDTGYITDIHLKRVTLGGRAFAGYRWTEMERTSEETLADMVGLSRLVDRDTVLVTHSPPRRFLEIDVDRRAVRMIE